MMSMIKRGWITVWIVLLGWQIALSGTAPEGMREFKKGVVRIQLIAQIPDFNAPWDPGRLNPGGGTGFLISGKRVLTNAHVASNARYVTVAREGDSRRYEARVKYVAHDCDLAMLEVLDPAFFEGMRPLEFGEMPELDSTVTALGYPIGGDRLSVTRGVVSRIDFQVYSHSAADNHLAIQIDAAINPGNSGGPVLQDDKVVGIAFQGFSGRVAQNVGYMIPLPVIRRFLKDVEDGHYDRYVDLAIEHFPLINPAYRRALGLDDGNEGVVVSKVMTAGASAGLLRHGDVLLAIDGHPIFSDGRVDFDGERVLLNEVVERKFLGDQVQMTIFREGQTLEISIPLSVPWPYLIQARAHDIRPRYVMFGGLVFQPLSRTLVQEAHIQNLNARYHYTYFLEKNIYIKRPEVIVISNVLSDPINTYLKGFKNAMVDSVNDVPVKTLEDLWAAFQKPEAFYRIKLYNIGRPVVLARKDVLAAQERIMKRYGVQSQYYLKDSIVPPTWLEKIK